jgi:outer membrane immunogenic protein
MRNNLKAALASAAFLAIGPMASMAGAPAVTPGFQGWYIGGHVAYDFGDVEVDTGVNGVGPARSFGDDVDGWSAGLQAGYNHIMGRWMIGAELSASGMEVDGVSSNVGGPPISFETDYNWRADITARLGYLVTDNTALYIEGGWSFADIGLHSVIAAGPYSQVSDDGIEDGWTAGAGIEHKLNDGVSAFIEYSYTDYGTGSFINTNGGPAALIEHDNEIQAVKVGLNFKLN